MHIVSGVTEQPVAINRLVTLAMKRLHEQRHVNEAELMYAVCWRVADLKTEGGEEEDNEASAARKRQCREHSTVCPLAAADTRMKTTCSSPRSHAAPESVVISQPVTPAKAKNERGRDTVGLAQVLVPLFPAGLPALVSQHRTKLLRASKGRRGLHTAVAHPVGLTMFEPPKPAARQETEVPNEAPASPISVSAVQHAVSPTARMLREPLMPATPLKCCEARRSKSAALGNRDDRFRNGAASAQPSQSHKATPQQLKGSSGSDIGPPSDDTAFGDVCGAGDSLAAPWPPPPQSLRDLLPPPPLQLRRQQLQQRSDQQHQQQPVQQRRSPSMSTTVSLEDVEGCDDGIASSPPASAPPDESLAPRPTVHEAKADPKSVLREDQSPSAPGPSVATQHSEESIEAQIVDTVEAVLAETVTAAVEACQTAIAEKAKRAALLSLEHLRQVCLKC